MSLDTKFLATGDLVNGANSTTTAGKVGAYHTGGTASGCVILGDNAYNDGSSSDFTSNFDPDWGTYLFKSGRPWIRPTTGSHDYGAWGASGAAGSGVTGYKSYYSTTKSLPIWDTSFPPNAGLPYNSYFYSEPILDTAGGSTKWLLISLSGVKAVTSNKDTDGLMVSLAPGSVQNTWLSGVLTAAQAAGQYCMIASGHAYYSCTDDHHAPETRIKPVWDLIQSTGMMGRCVVLSGHHHNYQRFKPQDNNGNLKTDSTGCAQFIIGTAGLSTGYTAQDSPTNWGTLGGGGNAYTNTVHGFAEFTLTDTGYSYKFINSANDAVFDSGSTTLAATTTGPGTGTGGDSTTSTFTIPTEDNGLYIRCVVTATNADGSTTTPTAAALIGGSSAIPANQTAPVVSPSSPFVGGTVTTTTGTWNGSPSSYSYLWQTQDSGGTTALISGATAATYQPLQAQLGLRIRSAVAATNGSGTSFYSASTWTDPIASSSPTPSPVAVSPALWQVTLTDAAGQPISNITTICAQKTLTFTLNRPASMSFVVKSDDPSVSGNHSDGFPYLHELNRGVRAYRFENGQYVLRFSGHIWQVEDSGDPDKCQTAVTCFDPLMMANARIMRRMTTDPLHFNLINGKPTFNVLDWTPSNNTSTNSQGKWPIYTMGTGSGSASADDQSFTFDVSNVDSVALASACIDRANSVGWTGMSSGPPTDDIRGLQAFWKTTVQSGLTISQSASLFGGFPFGQNTTAYHFENVKATDAIVQISESTGFDFYCVPDESPMTIGSHNTVGQPMLGFTSGLVKQFGYLRIFPDNQSATSNMILGYGMAPNNIATLSRLVDGANWVNALVGVGDTISTVFADSAHMATIGLSEDVQIESDISIQQLLDTLIAAEVSISSVGQTTVTIGLQPGLATSFEPWADFDLGQYATINAGPILRGGFMRGRVRIYGFTLTIDDDKGEVVYSLQLAPTSATGAL